MRPRRRRERPWAGGGSKFQVLRSVVVLDAVEMMHVFSGQEMPAEHLLHDKNVLEDIASVARPRVLRCPDHDVAALVPCPAAAPVAVRTPGLGATGGTGGVLQSLVGSARAAIVRPAKRAAQVPV